MMQRFASVHPRLRGHRTWSGTSSCPNLTTSGRTAANARSNAASWA